MSEHMRPLTFQKLMDRIIGEYSLNQRVFGLHESRFYHHHGNGDGRIFGESMELPLGPAAGPHTQLSQNILCAYLCGGRFFELKTVQQMDHLQIDKPCIDAQDVGYNVEWSQELTLAESAREYVHAWIILHLAKELFSLSVNAERGFVFNMSVGYDLKGIQSPKMDLFISQMRNAGNSEMYQSAMELLRKYIAGDRFRFSSENKAGKEFLQTLPERISAQIANSVTLSTMHGCPPDEIERIARYLIQEKGLHTYVKLNPTLLPFGKVTEILRELGFDHIMPDEAAFKNDLQMLDAVPMLKRLQEFAVQNGRRFGVKLSNTLGVSNNLQRLPGRDMYLSGRALYPLTILLAAELSELFNGALDISFSGGATIYTIPEILKTGISPVTLVTDLLKPGGYLRLQQIAETISNLDSSQHGSQSIVDVQQLCALAEVSIKMPQYQKNYRPVSSIKINKNLPPFDCYTAPCREACPIHQDVPEYIRLCEEKLFPEACRVITEKNPLPHITGYICDHQCMNHCTRWDYDQPVKIRDIKKIAAEKGFDDFIHEQENLIGPSKKSAIIQNSKIAVVGAGPSGLSIAKFLTTAGSKVTVFEKTDRAGGTVQHLIPDFRLPQHAIDKDVNYIQADGVEFRFSIDEKTEIKKLWDEGFSYIYFATGAGQSKELKLEAGSSKVIDVIDFLWDVHHGQSPNLGRIVAVIGGGNSAMDGARAALRSPGVDRVYIIYRRTVEFMPADREEITAALEDGIEFRELLMPLDWKNGRLKCQKMRLSDLDVDGRRKAEVIPDEFEYFNLDAVIAAIGEQVELEPLIRNGLEVSAAGQVKVNPQSNETSIPNVFIGGDALRGPATVIEAIADARQTADEIIRRDYSGKNRLSPDSVIETSKAGVIDTMAWMSDLEKRKGVIDDTPEDGITPSESERCLGCSMLCNTCVDVCPNRANVAVAVGNLKDAYQILHIDELCNECGNCETFCPWQGAPHKDKPTLFSDDEAFNQSSRNGFVFIRDVSNTYRRVRLRYNSGEKDFVLNQVDQGVEIDTLDQNLPNDSNFQKLLLLAREIITNYAYLLM